MITLDSETEIGDLVAGIDEAGRGPLVGGVFAACVHVPLMRAQDLLHGDWCMVNDSKKLSAKKREALAAVIRSTADCIWSVASATPREIDQLNILRATHLAMRRAAEGVIEQMGEKYPRVDSASLTLLVDGLPVCGLPRPSRNIIKGDTKSLLIAAASILAKTARDADCLRLDALYPNYGFAQHKGYPVPAHLIALELLGPCPEHRRSFGPVATCIGKFEKGKIFSNSAEA